MSSTPLIAADQPILPPSAVEPRDEIARLRDLLIRDAGHLRLSNGEDQVPLPAEACAALRQVLDALASEQAVTILPTNTLLTTQQAADFLGVSRPTLIKILESGQIPYLTPGRHRRIALSDLLAYRDRAAAATARALDELMRDSAEFYSAPPTGR